MFKTVLFPVDLSREAHETVDQVINILKTYQSPLVLVLVVEVVSEGQKSSYPEMTSS